MLTMGTGSPCLRTDCLLTVQSYDRPEKKGDLGSRFTVLKGGHLGDHVTELQMPSHTAIFMTV